MSFLKEKYCDSKFHIFTSFRDSVCADHDKAKKVQEDEQREQKPAQQPNREPDNNASRRSLRLNNQPSDVVQPETPARAVAARQEAPRPAPVNTPPSTSPKLSSSENAFDAAFPASMTNTTSHDNPFPNEVKVAAATAPSTDAGTGPGGMTAVVVGLTVAGVLALINVAAVFYRRAKHRRTHSDMEGGDKPDMTSAVEDHTKAPTLLYSRSGSPPRSMSPSKLPAVVVTSPTSPIRAEHHRSPTQDGIKSPDVIFATPTMFSPTDSDYHVTESSVFGSPIFRNGELRHSMEWPEDEDPLSASRIDPSEFEELPMGSGEEFPSVPAVDPSDPRLW